MGLRVLLRDTSVGGVGDRASKQLPDNRPYLPSCRLNAASSADDTFTSSTVSFDRVPLLFSGAVSLVPFRRQRWKDEAVRYSHTARKGAVLLKGGLEVSVVLHPQS